jgi:branched-chain amino acid transport system permease protein
VGAIVGGMIVGMAEAIAIGYVPVAVVGFGFPGVVPYLLMLIVLMVKPHGLFGTVEVRRV